MKLKKKIISTQSEAKWNFLQQLNKNKHNFTTKAARFFCANLKCENRYYNYIPNHNLTKNRIYEMVKIDTVTEQ